ncbi:MAG: hypothetical protein JWN04_5492 [Myxococcaceae bacterium]|nr:hypothetical protein [Myxococcaceae bacterium]
MQASLRFSSWQIRFNLADGGPPPMEDAVLESLDQGRAAQGVRLGLVAGGVISSYRASLVERDLWEHVCALFESRGPYAAALLERVTARDWVELEAFVVLLDVIGETMGLDELRTLVRKRIVDPAGSNFYAPIVRSWARSFSTPEHMLHGIVHVWRAALRNAGRVRHLPVRTGEVHLIIEGPLEAAYRGSPALATELEGLAFSLLDSAQPRPVFVEVELRSKQATVALVCSFRN